MSNVVQVAMLGKPATTKWEIEFVTGKLRSGTIQAEAPGVYSLMALGATRKDYFAEDKVVWLRTL